MSSNALESQGMLLQRGDGASPEVFTPIPEITNLGGPDGSASEIPVTDLSSTAVEIRMGLKDEGSISMDINLIPQNTIHAGLLTDRDNRTLRNFRMIFTDSPVTTWSFAAYVMSVPVANAVDGVTTSSVSLRISGAVTRS